MFHSFRFGDLEIFRLDGVEASDGSNVINISNDNAATDSRPSRSPNDELIVFQSNRDGNVELYLSDSQGKAQTRLTNSTANNINAMFGPDNQSVIFQSDRNGNWDIYIVDIDGSERQLTTSSADDVNPYWSPDKDWIVFQSNRRGSWNVYLLNISTGTEYTITDVPYDVVFPSWSPNGEQLAYFSNWNGNWVLYVSDTSGENVKRITQTGNAGNATWSPEGDRIAFQIGGETTDVFTYDLSNDTQYQLTEFPGPDSAPTWDCAGANIAFTSLSNGNLDIFSVPWQGGGISHITVNPASDKWSEWSPSKEPASRGY